MGMLISVDFAQRARRRGAIEPGSQVEILFFTGVRYERYEAQEEAPLLAAPKRKTRGRKPLKRQKKKSA